MLLMACTTSTTPTPAILPSQDQGSPPSPTGTQLDSHSPSPWPASWVGGTIDQAYTTPALEFRSTGTYLIWSTGARVDPAAQAKSDSAPDLFGATPGGKPVLLYDNPNRDSRLEFIGGYGGRFAFVEDNIRVFGQGGWKLWYLPRVGAEAKLIDQGVGGQLAFFAMSERFLVWTHGDRDTSQLRVLELATMRQRILISAPYSTLQFWFPHLDGSHLVYNTDEATPDGASDQCRVWFQDLSTDQPAVRLDATDTASEPAIHGDDVVWKEQTDRTLSFLNAGTLVHYALATRVAQPLAMPTFADLGFTEPTVGDHYATAWPESDRLLYIADLQTGAFPAIADLGPTNDDPHDSVGHPDLAGDLLAYIYGPAKGDLELRWLVLH